MQLPPNGYGSCQNVVGWLLSTPAELRQSWELLHQLLLQLLMQLVPMCLTPDYLVLAQLRPDSLSLKLVSLELHGLSRRLTKAAIQNLGEGVTNQHD
jgi:hypothetical protein